MAGFSRFATCFWAAAAIAAFAALSANGRAAPAKPAPGAAPRAVAFESSDLVEKWSVSGLWLPDQVLPSAGLSGAAIFLLINRETGETVSAAVNGVALLPPDYWKNHGVADPFGADVATLADKVRAAGVIRISLSPDTRAMVVDCGSLDWRADQTPSTHEKCLKLGTAAVDVQDVDFDGTKEFVFRQAGQAQRGVDAYEIVGLPYDKNSEAKERARPLSELDAWSEINISKKQIILHESGGACASADETYARDPQSDLGMKLTRYRQYAADGQGGACYLEDYAVKEQIDGQSYCFMLISRRPAK